MQSYTFSFLLAKTMFTAYQAFKLAARWSTPWTVWGQPSMGYKTLFEQIKTVCAWNSLRHIYFISIKKVIFTWLFFQIIVFNQLSKDFPCFPVKVCSSALNSSVFRKLESWLERFNMPMPLFICCKMTFFSATTKNFRVLWRISQRAKRGHIFTFLPA